MSTTSEDPSPIQRICNLVPSRDTDRDWGFEHALAASAIEAPIPALPPSLDLRTGWWDIGNQENTGSCVGWASTDGVARYHLVKAAKLPKDGRLSARFTWMASKETDEFTKLPETFIEVAGTSLKAALDILRKYGCVPESVLPLHIGSTMYAGDEKQFFALASNYRIASYYNLGKDLMAWRTWLAANGPILTGLYVDETWSKAADTHGKLDTFKPSTAYGGHAICIVGYTTDNRFIVRNSWGTSWGDKGFAYASENYIAQAFYNEAYGITV
ncbi:MAG: C1 family peptidase [Solidesulfovibrio sp. DCME]|uniref:C1 family peptidase n=1 Tax=Solidesulfovibrio sp. DCME TaxID=3447380 RepID=UPI003D09AB73